MIKLNFVMEVVHEYPQLFERTANWSFVPAVGADIELVDGGPLLEVRTVSLHRDGTHAEVGLGSLDLSAKPSEDQAERLQHLLDAGWIAGAKAVSYGVPTPSLFTK